MPKRFRAPAGQNIGSIALAGVVHRPDEDGVFHLPDEHANRVIGMEWEPLDEPKIEGLTPAEVAEIGNVILTIVRRRLAEETPERQKEILAEFRSGAAFDDLDADGDLLELRPERPAGAPDSRPLSRSSDETLKAAGEPAATGAG